MLSILEANYRGEKYPIYISDDAIKYLNIHLNSLKPQRLCFCQYRIIIWILLIDDWIKYFFWINIKCYRILNFYSKAKSLHDNHHYICEVFQDVFECPNTSDSCVSTEVLSHTINCVKDQQKLHDINGARRIFFKRCKRTKLIWQNIKTSRIDLTHGCELYHHVYTNEICQMWKT